MVLINSKLVKNQKRSKSAPHTNTANRPENTKNASDTQNEVEVPSQNKSVMFEKNDSETIKR